MLSPPLELNDTGWLWRPEWIRPYESFWSILQTLMTVNVITVSDALKSLCKGNKRSTTDYLQELGIYANCNIVYENVQAIGIGPDHFLPLSVYRHNSNKEMKYVISERLRLCPACMKEYQYHSYLHQLQNIKECPWHHVLLEESQDRYSVIISTRYAYHCIDSKIFCESKYI